MLASTLITVIILISSASAAPHSLHRRLPFEQELADLIIAYGSEMGADARLELFEAITKEFGRNPSTSVEDALKWFAMAGDTQPQTNGAKLILAKIQASGKGAAAQIAQGAEREAVPVVVKSKSSTTLKQVLAGGLVGTGILAVGAGSAIAIALGHHKSSKGEVVVGSGQVPEEGAFSEADERGLLAYIKANPDKYDSLWAAIQKVDGLSDKEYKEFEAANPNKPNSKRGLLNELD